MADPIEVNYTPDGDDWTVLVKGRGQTLTGKAVGLIAARDRADQLVDKLTPGEAHKTVVHLLNGDAVEFTTAYLTARLAKTEPPAPLVVPPPAAAEKPEKAEPAKRAASAGTSAPRKGAEAEQPPEPKPRPKPSPVPRATPPAQAQSPEQAAKSGT